MCLTPPVGETSTSTPVELDRLVAEGAGRGGHGSIGKWLLLDGRGFSVSAAGEASLRFGMLASPSLRSLERLRPEVGRSEVLFHPPQSSSLVGEGASGSASIFCSGLDVPATRPALCTRRSPALSWPARARMSPDSAIGGPLGGAVGPAFVAAGGREATGLATAKPGAVIGAAFMGNPSGLRW